MYTTVAGAPAPQRDGRTVTITKSSHRFRFHVVITNEDGYADEFHHDATFVEALFIAKYYWRQGWRYVS